MYAVIKTGGKQHHVAPGDEVRIEKLRGDVGEPVTFEHVLLASDGENVRVGQPYVEGSKVMGTIVRQDKDKKILVLKRRRRKGYRKLRGHRQPFTLVRIENIEA